MAGLLTLTLYRFQFYFVSFLLADSMADRGSLEVGDELFSVDNLCCSFSSDRPILISTLNKLHQVLQRLAVKQRPVEVKILRGHDQIHGHLSSFCPLSVESLTLRLMSDH